MRRLARVGRLLNSLPLGIAALLLAVYCLLLTVGCAVVSRFASRSAAPAAGALGEPSVPDDGYRDFTGVIHVHTTYSHDAHGTFEDVVRSGNAHALDYVILTEHNNLRALAEGRQGWHGAVLVLVGVELSIRSGHLLAMNVTEEIERTNRSAQQIIDEVARQGGFSIIAHPYFAKARWTDWSVTGFTGIEVYNVAHDAIDENKARLALWTLFSPREPFYWSIIDRPYDPLRTWDGLIARNGRVVGIGSLDAHEFHAMGIRFAPYDDMFRLCRTHVLIRPDSLPDGRLTPGAVYDALRQGHAYLSIDLVEEVRRFDWMAEDGAQALGIMGDEVVLRPGLHLAGSAPLPALLTVFHDGRVLKETVAKTLRVPIEAPGAYRLEASRNGKPWIISNPIYVRAAPSALSSSAAPLAPASLSAPEVTTAALFMQAPATPPAARLEPTPPPGRSQP